MFISPGNAIQRRKFNYLFAEPAAVTPTVSPILSLHYEGPYTPGDPNSWVDSSSFAHVPTALYAGSFDPALSSARALFGTQSGLYGGFPGSLSGIEYSTANFNPGSAAFTYETAFFVDGAGFFPIDPDARFLWYLGDTTAIFSTDTTFQCHSLRISTVSGITAKFCVGSTVYNVSTPYSAALYNEQTWQRVAVSRIKAAVNDTLVLYMNGVPMATTLIPTGAVLNFSGIATKVLMLGGGTDLGFGWLGYMDETRFTADSLYPVGGYTLAAGPFVP